MCSKRHTEVIPSCEDSYRCASLQLKEVNASMGFHLHDLHLKTGDLSPSSGGASAAQGAVAALASRKQG